MRIPVDKSRVSVKQGFKTCGLCSEKSDSSVDLPMDLRVFLKTFLSPPNPDYDLPYKLCLKCYKTTSDAKNFRDKSNSAMTRLLKEGRRDLYSKDRRRPKIILDWKDIHNAEKVVNRIAREEREESPEDVAMVDDEKTGNKIMERTSTKMAEEPRDNRVPETKITHSSASNVQVSQPVANIPNDVNEQLSDAMDVIQTTMQTDAVEDTSSLVEEEEQFPESGPYQCELCNEIFETKEEFLNDVKTKHANEVDSEVIEALEKDVKIREAKKKAGIIS